jgi:hypothetical protein
MPQQGKLLRIALKEGNSVRNLWFHNGEYNTHKENKGTKTKWDTAGHNCRPVAASMRLPCVPAMAREVKISLTL